MASAPLELVGIGNAIVDVIASCDDGFLDEVGLSKGAMTLVDEAQAEAIYAKMGPGMEMSGGSVGNSMAGFASLGGRGAYIGKVRDDQLGSVFGHDLRAQGVGFDCKPATSGPSTARCLVLVTHDAQRTMATYLGACVDLGPDDLDEDKIAEAKVTYLEGYLFDPPHAKAAFRKAAGVARRAGREVALSLSDAFCVARHRDDFADFIANDVDVLFANESEITAMAQTDDVFQAIAWLRGRVKCAAVTRSEKGAVVLSGDDVVAVSVDPVDRLIDTTGAGDLFAAGFLFGHVRGMSPEQCARLGGVCAAEVISHYGARPQTSLKSLARAKLPGLPIA